MLLTNLSIMADACKEYVFFGIPTWYKYLKIANIMQESTVGSCELVGVHSLSGWVDVAVLIALAVVDMLLRIAGLVAVGFIISGGVTYVTSTGMPDKAKEAQESIINALIGLTISVIAIGFVSFIGHRVGVEVR